MSQESGPAAVEQKSVTEIKMETAKQKKDIGDAAFKAGEIKDALRSYHESLMYLVGLDKNAMKSITGETPKTVTDDATGKAKEEKTEADEIVEKIYANMSACHITQKNWQRALESADKAIKKNENNYKALFRKGKALGELGYFEKAEKLLEDLAKKDPDNAAGYNTELERLRAIDNEREKAHKQKLKGFLSREKKSTTSASLPADASGSSAPTSIA